MPDSKKRTYSTGELAEACGVSVRTVQFYDQKGLLPPASVSEGGRRIYTEDDAAKLRKILLLKSLGLQLSAIRGVLDSSASAQLLKDILKEQDQKLNSEIAQRQQALETVMRMRQGLEERGELPAESISGMEDIMQNDKDNERQLQKFNATMLGAAIPLGIAELAALAHWVRKGDWKPFAAVELVNIPLAFAAVRFYREHVVYRCPHCQAIFKPETREWFFAMHTPTTRKLTCTNCGTSDWCTEVYSDSPAQEPAAAKAEKPAPSPA